MSSIVLEYHWILSIALFKSFGSRHSLRLLLDFITGTIELIHSVCSLTSVIMPYFTSLFCMLIAWLLGLALVGTVLVCTLPSVWCGMVLLAGFSYPWKHHCASWTYSLWWWVACVFCHCALWSLCSILSVVPLFLQSVWIVLLGSLWLTHSCVHVLWVWCKLNLWVKGWL